MHVFDINTQKSKGVLDAHGGMLHCVRAFEESERCVNRHVECTRANAVSSLCAARPPAALLDPVVCGAARIGLVPAAAAACSRGVPPACRPRRPP